MSVSCFYVGMQSIVESTFALPFVIQATQGTTVRFSGKARTGNEEIDLPPLLSYTGDKVGTQTWQTGLSSIHSYVITYCASFSLPSGDMELTGVVTLWSPDDTATIKFASLSCNVGYAKKGGENGATNSITPPTGLWSKLEAERPGVILHMGDAVYADDVYKAAMASEFTADDIYGLYAQHYIKTFSRHSSPQMRAMRNAQNAFILDDHEVSNNFGSKAFMEDKKNILGEERKEANKQARVVHQALRAASAYELGVDNGTWKRFYNIGKYRVVFLDERVERWTYNKFQDKTTDDAFVNNQIGWFASVVKACVTRDNTLIVVSPRPIGITPPWLSGDDDLLNAATLDNTQQLLRSLTAPNVDPQKTLILSGDAHQTMLIDITNANGELVARQMVSSAISRASRSENLLSKLKHFIRHVPVFSLQEEFTFELSSWSMDINFGIVEKDQLRQVIHGEFVKHYELMAQLVWLMVLGIGVLCAVGLLVTGGFDIVFLRLFQDRKWNDETAIDRAMNRIPILTGRSRLQRYLGILLILETIAVTIGVVSSGIGGICVAALRRSQ
jgi:hypothetical protein